MRLPPSQKLRRNRCYRKNPEVKKPCVLAPGHLPYYPPRQFINSSWTIGAEQRIWYPFCSEAERPLLRRRPLAQRFRHQFSGLQRPARRPCSARESAPRRSGRHSRSPPVPRNTSANARPARAKSMPACAHLAVGSRRPGGGLGMRTSVRISFSQDRLLVHIVSREHEELPDGHQPIPFRPATRTEAPSATQHGRRVRGVHDAAYVVGSKSRGSGSLRRGIACVSPLPGAMELAAIVPAARLLAEVPADGPPVAERGTATSTQPGKAPEKAP